jgi:hypothetical protein
MRKSNRQPQKVSLAQLDAEASCRMKADRDGFEVRLIDNIIGMFDSTDIFTVLCPT